MLRRILASSLALLALSLPAAAAELRILPDAVALHGPHGSQRLLVVLTDKGRVIADVTPQAKVTSSDPAVAKLDAGVVRAVSDGASTLTATYQGQSAEAKATVQATKAEFAWSFRNHVEPVLTRIGCNSGACHGALAGKGGFKLALRGYDPDADHFVLTRQALGRRVDRQDPAHSLMLLKPTLAVPHGGGKKLDVDSPEYQILADWIASGAAGPKLDDPRVTKLEVLPAEAMLKPKDSLQVLVRAVYSDGRSADVTRWAKFSSSEDLVATVDADGQVRVAGHGEAAISVLFANQVASTRVVSPYPHALDERLFTSAAKHNFIDEHVLRKLQELRLPPSPLCGDSEFIRRAFLDAAGILPTPEEVTKFVADASSDKRAKLIDALLERSEFVDYWAYKWSDLLLVSTRKLPQQSVWAFYQFIRQSVADNKPWDRFARDIVTARGSNLQNGAASYFVLHRDTADLTEATSITFLGTSITCARCHNHPLEKWTQDQYWSMANLFSRVALKNGDRGGEVIVQSQSFGDVPHLRKGVPMPPTPLDGKPLAFDSLTDRRQYFADWLTSPENPYFAKALVNRIWRNFLGRGLVEAEDDLRQTNPPTDAALFDALAQDFVKHKYDVKHLVRTIMSSAAYQRSSRPLPENASDDRFYSHYLIRRLPAEVVLDAYAQVTGVPTLFTQVNVGSTGGQTATSLYPPGTRALQLPDSLLVSTFLDSFGRPNREQTCACERQQDSSVGQALHLNNGKTLNDKLRDKNSHVEKSAQEKISDEEVVKRVYLLALSREPTPAEMKKFTALLTDGSPRREVLEDLFWAVLTSKEFVFNR